MIHKKKLNYIFVKKNNDGNKPYKAGCVWMGENGFFVFIN